MRLPDAPPASEPRAARWAWLFAGLLGCAHAPPTTATTQPQREDPSAEARALVSEVTSLRGLPAATPVQIQALTESAFLARLHATSEKKGKTGDVERELATWIAFGFAPPKVRAPDGTKGGGLVDGFLGFYDYTDHTLVLRQTLPEWAHASAEVERGVMVHEIEHAIQDQNFGFPDFGSIPDRDALLARKALYEGDATLVRELYAGRQSGEKNSRSLDRGIRALRALPTETLIKILGASPAALKAAPIAREQMFFLYFAGMTFVGDIYRTGGFALVNQLFSHPPSSTEQVLHPEKYLTGDEPIPVAAPSVPSGTRRVVTGKLGELQIRVLLARCLSREESSRAAEGWGGDAFTIVEGPRESLALLWSTVWDTEESAIRFEAALRESNRCWPQVESRGRGQWIPARNTVRRDGTKVAYVRGLEADALENEAQALLALPGVRAPLVPPLGALHIAPPELPLEDKPELRGVVANGRYTSTWLGVSALVPEGFIAATQGEHSQLLLKHAARPVAVAMFTVSTEPKTETFNATFFKAFVASFESSAHLQLSEVAKSEVSTNLGSGEERQWVAGDKAVGARVVLIPTCDAKASFSFIMSWRDPAGKALLDSWFTSFKRTGVAPMCSDLAK